MHKRTNVPFKEMKMMKKSINSFIMKGIKNDM